MTDPNPPEPAAPDALKTGGQRLLQGAILLALALLIGKLALYHVELINFPYQVEYREGAMVHVTQGLLDGINPYAFESQPRYTNVYGIGYHAVVYPLAKWWGNGLAIHRAVTGFFIFGICSLLFLAVRRRDGWVPAFAIAALGYAMLMFYVSPVARPDTLGAALFLAALLLPWWRRFSIPALGGSVVLGILAFLTKPYFILALPMLALFLFLFRSKRLGILFGVAAAAGMALTVGLIQLRFEMYFYDTFVVNTHFYYKTAHMISQFWSFIIHFKELLAMGAAVGFVAWRKRDRSQTTPGRVTPNRFETCWRNADAPLFTHWRCGLIPFCFWIGILVNIYPLGGNIGNYMTYLMHLSGPFLLIMAAAWIRQSMGLWTRWPLLSTALVGGLLINAMVFTSSLASAPTLDPDNLRNWRKLEQLIVRSDQVFASPPLTSILTRHGKVVYNSGHSEYFATPTQQNITGLSQRAGQQDLAFRATVRQMVNDGEFDTVLLDEASSEAPFVVPAMLNRSYRKTGRVYLYMPHPRQTWVVNVWIARRLLGKTTLPPIAPPPGG